MSIDFTQENDLQIEATTRTSMNTAKLKTFAQKARNILMAGVERKVQYWGFDNKGTVEEEPQAIAGGYMFRGNVFDDVTVPAKWKALRNAISRKGVKEVVEEAAYTWFNRLMAIRILAQNRYDLPQLEYAEGADLLPLLLQRARRGQFDFLSKAEQQRLQQVLLDYEKDTEAFGILLIGYCHSHTLLNNVFGGIDDYTELLLPEDILSESGFVHLLNTTDAITDEDYKQVELIGWLYQFYISEKKDEVFAGFKKNKKAEAADIPAATQIFTPNWIVKYMVQNTVGKLWLDLNPESSLKQEMRYLVEAPDQYYGDPIIKEVAELKLLDPAAGSGHILVEGFDLLYAMYEEEYFQPAEAVESILKHNLFGLDIDKRAAQLSRFAILLKAAAKHRDILKSGIMPHVYAMPEPAQFSRQEVLDFLGTEGTAYEEALTKELKLMQDAQNLGSIMQFSLKSQEREFIIKRYYELEKKSFREFSEEAVLPKIRPFIHVLELLTMKYEAVAANPPYMGQKSMNGKLKSYVDKHYVQSKSDLFAVFMEVCLSRLHKDGLMGMINQHSWMFLTSFKKLRENLLSKYFIESMVHLGPRTFEELSGEVVQTTSFILGKRSNQSYGVYYRLINYRNNTEKQLQFLKKEEQYSKVIQDNFFKIPGAPIAYWLTEHAISLFEKAESLDKYSLPRSGMSTTDNTRFLRYWHEVDKNQIKINLVSQDQADKENLKWIPYNKGGGIRWCSSIDFIVNWENNGKEIKEWVVSNPRDSKTKHWSRRVFNTEFFYKQGITWSDISSTKITAKKLDQGFIFDSVGIGIYDLKEKENYILALINSKVGAEFLYLLCPTIHFNPGGVSRLPVVESEKSLDKINRLVEANVEISKNELKRSELSFDFDKFYLLNGAVNLRESLAVWTVQVSSEFKSLHANEEEINSEFISIYELTEEITPDVPFTSITILQDELDFDHLEYLYRDYIANNSNVNLELPIKQNVVMRQLLSYCIGCFMGRYRLNKPGLQIAYPNPTVEETAPYAITSPLHGGTKEVTLSIDEDAIVPLMGKSCRFTDDALHRTVQFIEYVWGEETLTQNLNFLQECLDQDLEQYLVRDFWKDHVRTYKKKPIYWLFSSPKGAFQVLVYMHRMNRFTVTKIRDKYLLPHMQYLAQQIAALEGQGAALGRAEARQLDKLRKDLYECEQYDLLLKDKADQQIEFDLDNGVTANYELLKGVVAPIK